MPTPAQIMGSLKGIKSMAGQISETYGDAVVAGVKPVTEAFKKAISSDSKDAMEAMGENLANKKGLVAMYKTFNSLKQVASMSMMPFNAMMSVMDMFGVAQPILDIISGVVSIIGGGILAEMSDEIAEFAEVMFSPEMVEIWGEIGTAIGMFLGEILNAVTELFRNPLFINAIKNLMKIFMKLADIFVMIVSWIVTAIGDLSASELGAIIIAIAALFAFMQGYSAAGGGAWGVVAGSILAASVAALLSPLASLQHGGLVTRPTIAMIGEGGPEAVIPLDEAGGFGGGLSNQELLWATEDNGKRIDRLIIAMETQNKMKRLKML